MKKRILSLVLCAALLLSLCLFMGAGVAVDAPATEDFVPAVNFTNVAPLVQANAQAANSPARAAQLRAVSAAPAAPERVQQDALVTSKAATPVPNSDGTYKIRLESYSTGTVTQQTTTKPTDIVLVLDQSGSMANCIVCGEEISGDSYHWKYTEASSISNSKTYYIKNGSGYTKVTYCNGKDHTTGTCSGGPGWYTGIYRWDHTSENKITPKDSNHPNGTQFFERSEEACSSRLSALKKAVTTFVDQVSKEATENNVDHRIAIVGFSSDGYNNTEILTGCAVNNNNGVQYVAKPSSGTSRDYSKYISACGMALATPQSAKAAINYLEAAGGTETDKGMQMAKDILDNDSKKNDNRNRVVVLFTDGVPLIYTNEYDSQSTTDRANRAISISNGICDKATVYTVGVFSGANGDLSNGIPANTGNWNGANKPNRFMHLVSSNYPDATAMDQPGNVNPGLKGDDSYYLSAGDADTLNSIFEKIGNNISTPSIELGEEAQVRDIVSPYFTAPANADGITVYAEKAAYSGGEYTWTRDDTCTGMTAAVNGSTVTVTGFDYDANFVSQTGRKETNPKENGDFYGRRLVVEFNVTVKPEFLGGNYVPTNRPDSGVYDKTGKIVENFEYPTVDIPVKAPTLTAADKNIYYNGTQLTASDLCQAQIPANMGDYVTLSFAADKGISSTEDGNYTVTVTATPKYTIDGQEQSTATATTTASVNVYKPEITFNDSRINYGETADYNNNGGTVVWKHEGTAAESASMTGEVPALTYAYDPAEDAFTKDTYVKVTVTSDKDTATTKISDAVTFVHTKDTDFPGCSFDPAQGQFIVHINVFDLTIVKSAKTGTTIDPNQTFVFKVKNNDNGKTMEIVITGEGQKTVKSLPMGSYTITEDTGWSWQYRPTADTQTITVSETSKTVTFENEKTPTNWLTSFAEVINKWINGQIQQTEIKN